MYIQKKFFMDVVAAAVWHGPDIREHSTLVVDSRLIENATGGIYFLALKGAHADGHDFIHDALARGAAGIIAERMPADLALDSGITFVIVPDCLEALTAVARAWRAQMPFPIVGITGSVGKTSTKQLLGEILQAAGKKVLISQGNQNTVLGVSLNIWRLRTDHDVAIFEMGISKKGEMARMVDIVRPTLGIITYIGHSHMSGLGGCDGIAAEKRELFSQFTDDAIGIIQGDQPELTRCGYTHPIIKFGKKMSHQVQVRKVVVHDDHISCVLKIYHDKFPLILPTTHTAFLNCMLAATAAAHALDIDHSTIIERLQKPFVVPGRYEKKPLPDNAGVIFNDAYNASPESMKAALLAFEKAPQKNKVAVLGDMLELGDLTDFWHRQIGRFLKKVPSLRHLILVGSHVRGIQKTAPLGLSCILVPTWKDAVAPLKALAEKPDTAILLKASRGIALTQLVEVLQENH